MDIAMPEMDGVEATQIIKSDESGHNIVVIAVSASVFDEDKDRILRSGAAAFVRKPIRNDILFSTISDHTGLTFEQEVIPEYLDEPNNGTLGSDSLSPLTKGQLLRLHKAAKMYQLSGVKELVREFSNTHPKLANQLEGIIANFDWDLLEAISAEAISRGNSNDI